MHYKNGREAHACHHAVDAWSAIEFNLANPHPAAQVPPATPPAS